MRSTQKATALALVLAAGVAASGCTSLPTSGPTAGDIRSSAQRTADPRGLRIIEIDAATIDQLARTAQPAEGGGLAALARTSTVDRIGPGDVLSIQVFEVGMGLFSGGRTVLGQENAPPAASGSAISQGGVTVAEDGTIRIPYVGRIAVAGLTAAEVEQRITAGLAGKSQSPQVMVTIADNVANAVYMMGAISKPGRQPLTVTHEHLLDAIAMAGGTSVFATTGASTATGAGPQDYVVRLTRDGRTAQERLESIEPGAADDVLLAPGDRVNVIREPRTFVTLGAADRIAQIPFESRSLSLAEALARVGGPSDGRADPRAIYVFRDVPALRQKLNGATAGGEVAQSVAQPTIYRLNMMTADGLFLAQRFAMQDKDVLYVANAGANQPQKLAQIIGLLFSPFFAVSAAVR